MLLHALTHLQTQLLTRSDTRTNTFWHICKPVLTLIQAHSNTIANTFQHTLTQSYNIAVPCTGCDKQLAFRTDPNCTGPYNTYQAWLRNSSFCWLAVLIRIYIYTHASTQAHTQTLTSPTLKNSHFFLYMNQTAHIPTISIHPDLMHNSYSYLYSHLTL